MLEQNTEEMLFTSSELLQFTKEEKRITPLSVKLDELAMALKLIPQTKKAYKTKCCQYHKSRYNQYWLFAQDQLYVRTWPVALDHLSKGQSSETFPKSH
jgi:hypothetical protein